MTTVFSPFPRPTSMTFAAETGSFWPLGVYFAAVLGLVAGMLVLSHLLGQRHRERATGEPYESGMVPTGSPHVRFDVRFYLVALFFVIFDLEAAFLVAWAISLRETGWTGFIEAVSFIAVLLAGLVYLWRIGALDWAPKPRTRTAEHGEAVAARNDATAQQPLLTTQPSGESHDA